MERAEIIRKEIESLLAATVALVVVFLLTVVRLSGPVCRYLANGSWGDSTNDLIPFAHSNDGRGGTLSVL